MAPADDERTTSGTGNLAGATAADAAVAAGAVLAVTNQHQCGLGGDLFALVARPGEPVAALCAAGRAGSGADAARLRADGIERLPPQGDGRGARVPGCVDGLIELHGRFGRLPLAHVLATAAAYAATGFPASPLLAATAADILGVDGADDYRLAAEAAGGRLRPGTLVRRPGLAAALEGIRTGGRAAFYEGRFGDGLVKLGEGWFTPEDLERPQADWVMPLRITAWDHDVWTTPPPSQGYLTLAAAWIAGGLALPDDPDDPAWAHLLAEAARMAGADRTDGLFDGADGEALLDSTRLAERRGGGDPPPPRGGAPAPPPGGTTVCCGGGRDRTGVTLILSNASAWGGRVVEPATGVFLHNRGIGFSLAPGHPAELSPGRPPPHTLAPALVTRPDGSLRAVLGTMGGDSQPQVL